MVYLFGYRHSSSDSEVCRSKSPDSEDVLLKTNNVFSTSPHKTSRSTQFFACGPKLNYYGTQDVPSAIKNELEGKLEFDRPNVLHRLRIQDVDNKLVKRIRRKLENDDGFVKSRGTLDELRELAANATYNDEDDPHSNEEEMVESLVRSFVTLKFIFFNVPQNQIFDLILKLAVENDNGQARQYDRKWIAIAEKALVGEGDTFSFPRIKPDFTLCDDYKEVISISTKGKRKWEILWPHRMAFIEVKATIAQGPKPAEENIVKAIVSRAADYARLHLTRRPFLLFSIGLLIFGRQFCVAIFDRDGIQFSPVHDLWDELDILIRIIRRMNHEMSPVDLGQDPNVSVLPRDDPNSVACRNIATALAKGNAGLIEEVSNYPTYSIDFCNIKYYTVGLPVWNSLSLLGRGTSIWRVSASPSESLATGVFLILKTAWRQSNRPSESAIMQRVKGTHDGLVKYSQGSDVFFPSSNEITPPKITTANLRNLNRHVDGDTMILHRLIFETVGRPIWDFDSYLEFFLAIKAALNAHKFLADQGILHRDISAGNVLLSSNPNAPDTQKGFLTDLEFAQIDDKMLETKNIIPIPSVPNPTVPTTGTHTARTSPLRGAILTGTLQFMALELVIRFSGNGQQPIHRIYHDVESFIWVMYYGILRRIGYVERNLAEETIPADLSKISRFAFQVLFGHVYPRRIATSQLRIIPLPVALFEHQKNLWPLPIQQFFEDMFRLMHTMRGRWSTENDCGWTTHEELLLVLDKVIAALRKTP